MRWCTKQLKIKPLGKCIGDDPEISYVDIRVDEHRSGYKASNVSNIQPVYPFQERGLGKVDIFRLMPVLTLDSDFTLYRQNCDQSIATVMLTST